jgi:hypothetical protein
MKLNRIGREATYGSAGSRYALLLLLTYPGYTPDAYARGERAKAGAGP